MPNNESFLPKVHTLECRCAVSVIKAASLLAYNTWPDTNTLDGRRSHGAAIIITMLNEQETPKPHFSGDLAIGVLKIIRAQLDGTRNT